MSTAIPGFVQQGRDNLVRNVRGMWDGMRPRDYIRIVVVVGAYLLLRPYLLKYAAKIQAKEHAKHAFDPSKPSSNSKISPNQLRDGHITEIDENEQSEAEGDGIANGAGWGKKTRKRQRRADMKAIEDEERRKLQMEGEKDDQDIMQYLVDYEEGKDGW
ncbi:putative trafficking pga2 [Golovinomyces cichoracearum]|uniref:Putative trafficking pga2 n=1 Tax=Golovinomyces cichoracearum TaxID=62708 RepID=A0A420ITH6_9PEZI|nr:putative trafficking pga2 [Golovinomyces cichoracearum]